MEHSTNKLNLFSSNGSSQKKARTREARCVYALDLHEGNICRTCVFTGTKPFRFNFPHCTNPTRYPSKVLVLDYHDFTATSFISSPDMLFQWLRCQRRFWGTVLVLWQAGMEHLASFLRSDKKLQMLTAQNISTPSYYTADPRLGRWGRLQLEDRGDLFASPCALPGEFWRRGAHIRRWRVLMYVHDP